MAAVAAAAEQGGGDEGGPGGGSARVAPRRQEVTSARLSQSPSVSPSRTSARTPPPPLAVQGRVQDAAGAARRNDVVAALEARVEALEAERYRSEALLEEVRSEEEAGVQRLLSEESALQAARTESDASMREAQLARGRSQRQLEDLGERLRLAQASGQRSQAELVEEAREVSALLSEKRQLHSHLEADESARLAAERRLQAAQLQIVDLQARCEARGSDLQSAQSRNEVMHHEVWQARRVADEASELADEKHRLAAELLRYQGELTDARRMGKQDAAWPHSGSTRTQNLKLVNLMILLGAIR